MIENVRQLRKAMNKLTKSDCINVMVRMWGHVVIPMAFEHQVRAIQVLVHKGEINANDVCIVEQYMGDDAEMHEHIISIEPSGRLHEPFFTNFFSLNDDLVEMIMFN